MALTCRYACFAKASHTPHLHYVDHVRHDRLYSRMDCMTGAAAAVGHLMY